MSKLKNELGGVYVHIPNGARINIENKEELAPETKYEKRKVIIDVQITKNLCGGRYGQSNNQR